MRCWVWWIVPLFFPVPLAGQSDLAFPQIIVGESFETVVQIANEVAADEKVVFEVFSGTFEGSTNGAPLPVQFDQSAPAQSVEVQLLPFQERSLRLSLDEPGLKVGWLRARSTVPGGKVSGSLFYRIKSGDIVLESVGVTSARRYRFAQVQLDHADEGSDTGIGFVNPDETAVEIFIDLFRGGQFLERFSYELQPKQHFARLVSEIFPNFTEAAGTLLLETSASREIPFLTLRLDGQQLTSLPVRPLGFTLQYELSDEAESLVESGYWMLESEGLNIVGTGLRTGDAAAEGYRVLGSWEGTSFQCAFRRTLEDDSIGIVVFNGASQGTEQSEGASIVGKATVIGADGQVVAVYDFEAFSKY